MTDISGDELRALCDATVRLTEIRQRGCEWLCVENIGPEILRKLLITLKLFKEGVIPMEDLHSIGIHRMDPKKT